MTLLMYALNPAGVVIMTDTLATADDEPAFFVSKVRLYPHLQLAVAFTGLEALGAGWAAELTAGLMVLDIVELDRFAPARIRELAAGLSARHPGMNLSTSTIYHFGRSFHGGEYLGYVYRSEADFESEKLPYMFGSKPHPTGPYRSVAPDATEEWVEFARNIRAEQDLLPLGERVHIGGSLMATFMDNGAVAMQEVHRFEDYADHWNAMNRRRVRLAGV